MTKKKLCPLCNRRSPNRSCPARGDEICARCCGMSRASLECGTSCIYYKPAIAGKEVNETLPIFKVLKSKTEGMIKEVTRHDTAAGVCGTPDETMIYFVCDECR